jgi:hypothetical protein
MGVFPLRQRDSLRIGIPGTPNPPAKPIPVTALTTTTAVTTADSKSQPSAQNSAFPAQDRGNTPPDVSDEVSKGLSPAGWADIQADI